MTPRECGASESARSLRSRARVRAHPAPALPAGRDEEGKRVRVRVRERVTGGPRTRDEGGRFHCTLSRTAAASVPSRSLSGTCSAPPPSPNGPYPGCSESHYRHHCHLVRSTTLLHYYYHHYITTARALLRVACREFLLLDQVRPRLSSSSSSLCPRHVSVCPFVHGGESFAHILHHHCHYHYTSTPLTEPLPLYLRNGPVRAFSPHVHVKETRRRCRNDEESRSLVPRDDSRATTGFRTIAGRQLAMTIGSRDRPLMSLSLGSRRLQGCDDDNFLRTER